MSDTKFTPGPWRVADADHEGIADDDYKFIAAGSECYGHGEGGFEIAGYMGTANARLIAAAPELFEALEKLLRPYGVADTGMANAPAPLQIEFIAAVREAKDAIAKATGEQS
jgi:hypothetical protein